MYDLSCPSYAITVRPIGATMYRATGCGKMVVYECTIESISGGRCVPERPPAPRTF
ncbi:MAG: hypothetical protein KBF88_07995 [Polyangiaceae bacterium]|nr:hypothetical protein [Polyangiaceae bacterium]